MTPTLNIPTAEQFASGAKLMKDAAEQIRRDWSGSADAGLEHLQDYHRGVAAWLDYAGSFWAIPEIADQGRPADFRLAVSVAASAMSGTR